jgi:hypothetical protein
MQNQLLFKELVCTKIKGNKKTNTILEKSSYHHKTANDDDDGCRHSSSACHVAVGDRVV